jgi:hypothetical protein
VFVVIELIGRMGYVGYFYVESKSYELRLGDGNRTIKLTEWGRMNLSTLFLGEVRLDWLLKMMQELVLDTIGIGACRDHRMGSSVMFLQKRLNKYGKFMEITEYGRGGRRSFVVIPEGREGQGWKHCIVQLGRLVMYMEKTRDTELTKAPVKPRVVVPGRTFAAVVKGKNSEKGEEGKMGNSAPEINEGTVDKPEKGKEKELESENLAGLKRDDFLALLNEGTINMKMMREMLEVIKGKLEILEKMNELGCGEKTIGQMGSKHANDGNQSQLGQGENGLWSIRPKPCCSKTYYRKRHRAVTLRKAARLSRSAQTGPETSPEGSKKSSEVRRCDVTETISAGDVNHSLEFTKKASPASDKGPAMEKNLATEVVQSSGKSHDAGQGMGQFLTNRSEVNRTRRISPETLQILPASSTVPEKMTKGDLVGQTDKMNISDESVGVDKENIAVGVGSVAGYNTSTWVMGNSEVGDEGLEYITPEIDSNNWVVEEIPVESFAGDKSGMYGVENEEVLGVGNSEVVEEGLEDIIPETVSQVVDSCLEFYPKMGITCEGKEKNMRKLVECIANGRQQPIVEEGGIATSSRGFDRYVNYDRGMSEVQQVRERGRGNHGVL